MTQREVKILRTFTQEVPNGIGKVRFKIMYCSENCVFVDVYKDYNLDIVDCPKFKGFLFEGDFCIEKRKDVWCVSSWVFYKINNTIYKTRKQAIRKTLQVAHARLLEIEKV